MACQGTSGLSVVVRAGRLTRRALHTAADMAYRGTRWARRPSAKPRILLLADQPGWAYDHCARQMARHLADDFTFVIRYARDRAHLRARNYDLLYVYFWGEHVYWGYGFEPERVVKEVSSHRWQDDPMWGPCTPAEFAARYLSDAATVTCTSLKLLELVAPFHQRVLHTPNGYDPGRFHRLRERTGPMTVGWAGNRNDAVKGLEDVVLPACTGFGDLQIAPGDVPHAQMNGFYNELDVFVVASTHEGTPLPLIEAMAAGCFPVCTDVGVVPEVVQSGVNGIVVAERSPSAVAAALQWCETNIERVRSVGRQNAERMAPMRGWEATAPSFRQALWAALDLR